MALIKNLTPETARKAKNISIRKNYIVCDFVKPSKVYGVVGTTKAYKITPENIKVAKRYK